MRSAPSVELHWRERRELATLAEDPTAPEKIRLRARVVLRASEGWSNRRIASNLATDPGTVGRWRRRFLLHGTSGLRRDAPRPGRPTSIPESTVQRIIRATLDERFRESPRLSARALARETGVGKSTIQRIWAIHRIGSRRRVVPARGSPGMSFLANVTDMVGLYLNPPERAIAFSTDEALRSTRLERGEHRAIERLQRRSQDLEFRAFLQVVDRQTPAPLDVHLLLDSRFAPPPPSIARWLTEHPRFHLHFLPSDRAGATLIDRLVGEFSRRRVRPGESPSAQRLRHAIREHFRTSRGYPSPFVWTTSAVDVPTEGGRTSVRY